MPAKKKKSEKSDIKKLQDSVKQETSNEVELNDKSESVSSKKVIYIEIDDEVTAVYDKVKDINKKHVYIVAPKRSILFQSIVNLKILKRKAEDDKKKIYLVTNDSNGIHLAQKTGITVYSKATEGKPSIFSTEINDEKLRITSDSTTFTDTVTAPSGNFSGIVTATKFSGTFEALFNNMKL